MRMVVPLDDLDASRWINLTGASGHAYNDHYTDQTELWADGETLPWVFSPGRGRGGGWRHPQARAGRLTPDRARRRDDDVDRLVVRIRGYAVDHLVVVREQDPQDVRVRSGPAPGRKSRRPGRDGCRPGPLQRPGRSPTSAVDTARRPSRSGGRDEEAEAPGLAACPAHRPPSRGRSRPAAPGAGPRRRSACSVSINGRGPGLAVLRHEDRHPAGLGHLRQRRSPGRGTPARAAGARRLTGSPARRCACTQVPLRRRRHIHPSSLATVRHLRQSVGDPVGDPLAPKRGNHELPRDLPLPARRCGRAACTRRRSRSSATTTSSSSGRDRA